eukprot:scaffold6131_cov72-Attheya_sp.AAC.2
MACLDIERSAGQGVEFGGRKGGGGHSRPCWRVGTREIPSNRTDAVVFVGTRWNGPIVGYQVQQQLLSLHRQDRLVFSSKYCHLHVMVSFDYDYFWIQ